MKEYKFEKTGKFITFVTKPLVVLIVHGSKRARTIIRYDGKVLLVRGRLGSQTWSIPGGGIKRNESPAVGAAREVKEEVGITAPVEKLKLLSNGRHYSGTRQYYNYWLYEYEAPDDQFTVNDKEILEAQWFSPDELPDRLGKFIQSTARKYL